MPDSQRQRVSRALQEQRRRWTAVRFGLLASTLLLSIGVLMIFAPRARDRFLLQLVMYAPLVVGVYVLSDNTRFVVAWGAGLALTAVLGIFAVLRDEPYVLIVDIGLRCALLGALMYWVAREMVREVRVSLDTILGGICLYILIGYVYALIYLAILLADPTALVVGGQPLVVSLTSAHPLEAITSMFYFSFTAFTTMGFGDITPVSAIARYVTITEGMLGQLYPAIFIARLVSLNLLHSASPPTE